MTEKLYEGMFLLDSGKFAADPEGVSNQVLGLLNKAGAEVVAHRPWLDGRLAYEIEGQRKGLHYLAYFRMSGSGSLQDLTRSCKLNDVVLRHLVIKQPPVLFDAMVQALGAQEAAPEAEGAGEAEAAEAPKEDQPDETKSVETATESS